MAWWQALAAQGTAKGLGKLDDALTGLVFQGAADRRQLRQSKKLMALETKQSKEIAKFNQGLALDLWDKTGYGAQRQQMENAGLNVGLMYEGGGPGGTTAGAGKAESPSAGQAPVGGGEIGMAMQLGMQARMMQAQIENMQADTEKKQVEAQKIGGVDTQQAVSSIEQIKQNTANAAIQSNILEYEKLIKEAEANVSQTNQWETIRQMSFATTKLEGEARSAQQQGKINEETANSVIQQIKTNSIEQALRISAQKAGITKVQADTAKVLADKELGWMKWEQDEKERWVRENILKLTKQQTEFNTSAANEVKQWTSIITDILKSIQ